MGMEVKLDEDEWGGNESCIDRWASM